MPVNDVPIGPWICGGCGRPEKECRGSCQKKEKKD